MTVAQEAALIPSQRGADGRKDSESNAGLAVLGVVLAGIAVVFGVVAMGLSSRSGGGSVAVADAPKAKVVA